MTTNQKDSRSRELKYSGITRQIDKLFHEYQEISKVKNKPLYQKEQAIRQMIGEKLQENNIPPTDTDIHHFYGISVEIDYDGVTVSLHIHEEPGYLVREPIDPDKWRKNVMEALGVSENYITFTTEESYSYNSICYECGPKTYDYKGKIKKHARVYKVYRATTRSYTLKINYSQYCAEGSFENE